MNTYRFYLVDSYGHPANIELDGTNYLEALKQAMRDAYSRHIAEFPTVNVWFKLVDWVWKKADGSPLPEIPHIDPMTHEAR